MDCKFCLSEGQLTGQNRLINPCECNGTIKYVHIDCLKKWIETSQEPLKCRLCNSVYKFYSDVKPETFPNTPIRPLLTRQLYTLGFSLFTTLLLINENTDSFIYMYMRRVCTVAHLSYHFIYVLLYLKAFMNINNKILYLKKFSRGYKFHLLYSIMVYYLIIGEPSVCTLLTFFPPVYLFNHLFIISEINTELYTNILK
jgi:hypothetical protein